MRILRKDLAMKRCILFAIVAGFLSTSTGCTMLQHGQQSMVDMKRMLRPKPYDGPAKPSDDEDPWGFVGDEGRAGQDRERDHDRWWRNLIMSEEARNIERNLGID